MSDEEDSRRDVDMSFDVPPEWRVGVYANNASVWFSPYEFTLDWSISEPPEPEDPDDPESPLTMRNTVVARVRIPVGLIFDVMRTLNHAMSRYETFWGEIRRPG